MRNFKFFVGISKPTLSVDWVDDNWNDLVGYNTVDVEETMIRLMSDEIARTVDEDTLRRLTNEIINENTRI
jgi:hypothetical protein